MIQNSVDGEAVGLAKSDRELAIKVFGESDLDSLLEMLLRLLYMLPYMDRFTDRIVSIADYSMTVC